MKKIVLTGGGTAGHVTPNIALIPFLKDEGYEIHYIGSKEGIERQLIEKENIPYYPISSGKLRRYLSAKNISDMFRVCKGVLEAKKIIKKINPDIVFSKGGFVAVPVILGAKLNKIPIVIHESDITPGLTNKISTPYAKAVCTSFPETVKHIKSNNVINTGTPIRKELFLGDREKGLKICNFNDEKPVILVIGGSLGSVKINTEIRKILPEITKDFQVVHMCGKNNLEEKLFSLKGYKQFEYIDDELKDIFKITDLVISRAGSNSIFEFLSLKIPSLLIPLPLSVSRGDQILNAQSFEKKGFSKVLKEEDLNSETLINNIYDLYKNKDKYISYMEKSNLTNGVKPVLELIKKYTR